MIPAALFCTVHIAYYLWYGNPEHDGKWMHWDHKLLPHWNAATEAETARLHRLKYGWADEQSAWLPPVNQHSPFRPLRGLYSSSDDEVLRSHMLEMASVGVDTAMFSWWGRSDVKKRDDSGSGANTDLLLGAAMRHAKQASIEISIHVEPYGGRTPESFFEDAVYIGESYLARTDMRPASNRFTFWLYDVSIDHTAPNERTRWHDVLARVRTLYSSAHRIEVSFFCLWLHQHDAEFVRAVGFDGGYSYFASEGFTVGSTARNWRHFDGKLFVPAVGPGYNDTLIRPWNGGSSRSRDGGAYYDRQWMEAVASNMVTITSFNEWGEGTQIEPALAYSGERMVYDSYPQNQSDFYLRRTREWVTYYKRQCRERTAAVPLASASTEL